MFIGLVTKTQSLARRPGAVHDSVQVLVSQSRGGFLAVFTRTSVRARIKPTIHIVSSNDVGITLSSF